LLIQLITSTFHAQALTHCYSVTENWFSADFCQDSVH